jgi:outer membrane protein assembly factor BamB
LRFDFPLLPVLFRLTRVAFRPKRAYYAKTFSSKYWCVEIQEITMTNSRCFLAAAAALFAMLPAGQAQGWPQWGQDQGHQGNIFTVGQNPNRQLADLIYDPFVAQEQAENTGELLAHYQAPLTDGAAVYMEFISGTYNSCNPAGSYTPFPCGNDNWFNQVWNERRFNWENGRLVQEWNFASDWKPEPDATGELGGWQPVFHAALAGDSVYVPGAGGTIFRLDKNTGRVLRRFNPFGPAIDPNTFVSGPLTVDTLGNVYYNALQLNITNDPNTNDPWSFGPAFDGNNAADIPGAWLVKISEDGRISKVDYKTLIHDAPAACSTSFSSAVLPWPPSPDAKSRTVPCLSQRPGVNIAPAIASSGVIYTVSVAHNPFASRYAYVIALNPDLTLKWAASMRDRIHNGCGALLPIGGPGGCRAGTPANGVDPAVNQAPAGRVIDQSSSTPVVTPDGGVVYGAYARYNFARGNLFHFDADGKFVAAFDFGWDSTPAIYQREGTYSIVIKDNHYDAGSYCDDPNICPSAPKGPYFITQLTPKMKPEWKFQNTNTQSCRRNPDGTLSCVSDHPTGFEWCINAPAVDLLGNVFANSEDGNLYVIKQGAVEKGRLFLNLALGAAYTPLSLSQDGKIFTENDGHLFVVGH